MLIIGLQLTCQFLKIRQLSPWKGNIPQPNGTALGTKKTIHIAPWRGNINTLYCPFRADWDWRFVIHFPTQCVGLVYDDLSGQKSFNHSIKKHVMLPPQTGDRKGHPYITFPHNKNDCRSRACHCHISGMDNIPRLAITLRLWGVEWSRIKKHVIYTAGRNLLRNSPLVTQKESRII